MPEKKMNWGTLILGIIIGAVVVGVIWTASKPAATEGQARETKACTLVTSLFGSLVCDDQPGGGSPGCEMPPEIRQQVIDQVCGGLRE